VRLDPKKKKRLFPRLCLNPPHGGGEIGVISLQGKAGKKEKSTPKRKWCGEGISNCGCKEPFAESPPEKRRREGLKIAPQAGNKGPLSDSEEKNVGVSRGNFPSTGTRKEKGTAWKGNDRLEEGKGGGRSSSLPEKLKNGFVSRDYFSGQ